MSAGFRGSSPQPVSPQGCALPGRSKTTQRMEAPPALYPRLPNRSRMWVVGLRLVRAERAPKRLNRPCCPHQWIIARSYGDCWWVSPDDLIQLSWGLLTHCLVNHACSPVNLWAFGERCLILGWELQKHRKHLQIGRKFSNAPRQPSDDGCAHLDGRVSGHHEFKRCSARPVATQLPLGPAEDLNRQSRSTTVRAPPTP